MNGAERKSYHCALLGCGRTYASKWGLKYHYDFHHFQAKDCRFHYCPICGKRENTKTNLSNHTKRNHEVARPFMCEKEGCEKTFKLQYERKMHWSKVHNSKNLPFKCDFIGCSRHFLYRSYLWRHQRQVHFDLRIPLTLDHDDEEDEDDILESLCYFFDI